MTPAEIAALAERIAEILRKRGWVPAPVRPAPPGPPEPGLLPPWAAAAQTLSDVAPVPGRKTLSGRHRPAYDALTAAARAAAAGHGPAPQRGGSETSGKRGGPDGRPSQGRVVRVAVSNRHVHISVADFEKLFGPGRQLTPDRPIAQPGQFAAQQHVRVVGPKGAIERVRIVGPARGRTQVELAASDCHRLGLGAPVRHSGTVEGSAAARLEGPAGSIDLAAGVIVAARHVHVSSSDAGRLSVGDGDRVSVEVGTGHRRTTLHDVLVRAGTTHATELHVDRDEAQALGIKSGDLARLVGRAMRGAPVGRERRRALVTERDVAGIAARGDTLGPRGPWIVTPAARDRAKALGIWREDS